MLTSEAAIVVDFGTRQLHIMIDLRFVFRGATHFDHLHVVRTFENAVAYMGWLQNAISGLKDERGTLIFVNYAYPAAVAVDHLEFDIMVVHVIRHRPTVRDANVRRNESATPAIRNQIAVLHAGPPGLPFAVLESLHILVLLKPDTNTVT